MMTATDELATYRADVQGWIDANFPKSLTGRGAELLGAGAGREPLPDDMQLWVRRLGERGFGAPTWPTEFGGAGLNGAQSHVLADELNKAGAFNPIPFLTGMGVTMVGPTILEYGTDEQKRQHLPSIANGSIRWCLGLSEPNAGSDLASLTTRAQDHGDTWVINGQKVWTSGADISQWCGALVRTDASASKRDGISFLLLPMDQPGVRTRPIPLIAGASPFCETFFTDARAAKSDLLGPLNKGWTVVKRLLQHERASQTGTRSAGGVKEERFQDMAKRYLGVDESGRLADADLRARLTVHLMDSKAHTLTASRIVAEAKGKVEVSAAASILKNSATAVAQTRAELTLELMGNQGLGWEGARFAQDELTAVRSWLSGKAMSIYGGSFEVQNNIIAKNILGLPETTQKG